MNNQIILVASVVEMSSIRYTPVGLPALDLVLEHESSQTDAGQTRQVKLQLRCLAFGLIAERLLKQSIGRQMCFTGFLAQGRSAKSIRFHIQTFEPLDNQPAANTASIG